MFELLYIHSRWTQLHNAKLGWGLQEQWSLSAHTSKRAYSKGMHVGLPVAYRYGRDLNNKEHRLWVDRCDDIFNTVETQRTWLSLVVYRR